MYVPKRSASVAPYCCRSRSRETGPSGCGSWWASACVGTEPSLKKLGLEFSRSLVRCLFSDTCIFCCGPSVDQLGPTPQISTMSWCGGCAVILTRLDHTSYPWNLTITRKRHLQGKDALAMHLPLPMQVRDVASVPSLKGAYCSRHLHECCKYLRQNFGIFRFPYIHYMYVELSDSTFEPQI